jgi:hypothetical protein
METKRRRRRPGDEVTITIERKGELGTLKTSFALSLTGEAQVFLQRVLSAELGHVRPRDVGELAAANVEAVVVSIALEARKVPT